MCDVQENRVFSGASESLILQFVAGLLGLMVLVQLEENAGAEMLCLIADPCRRYGEE
ncbi:hypothetical protein SOVF_196740 isoform B [Spinacia oleracea]|nr:hypothetical protein SOVF_196740 isoform B [Spinacia oleracea]